MPEERAGRCYRCRSAVLVLGDAAPSSPATLACSSYGPSPCSGISTSPVRPSTGTVTVRAGSSEPSGRTATIRPAAPGGAWNATTARSPSRCASMLGGGGAAGAAGVGAAAARAATPASVAGLRHWSWPPGPFGLVESIGEPVVLVSPQRPGQTAQPGSLSPSTTTAGSICGPLPSALSSANP